MSEKGTRSWISEAYKSIKKGNQRTISNSEELLQIGKKLSQLITFIWFNEDPDTAQKLDGYFKRGDNEELKKLLFANEPTTDEYQLLLKVFKEAKLLPIFNQDDIEFTSFKIVVDKFEGQIGDPTRDKPGEVTYYIPYPPSPPIVDDTTPGYTTIRKSEVVEWLNQSPLEGPYIYEENPYIPSTSS
jgi:hypothetical protein